LGSSTKQEQDFKGKPLYVVQKALCIMFSNTFYQLHLEILDAILNAIKLDRMRVVEQL